MLKVGSCKSRQGTSTVQGLCRNTKVSLQVQQTAPLHCKSAELWECSYFASVKAALLQKLCSQRLGHCLLFNENPSFSLSKLTLSERDIHYPFILILKNLMINMCFFLCLIFNFVVYRLLRFVQQCQFRQRVINRHRRLQKVNPKLKSHTLRPRH